MLRFCRGTPCCLRREPSPALGGWISGSSRVVVVTAAIAGDAVNYAIGRFFGKVIAAKAGRIIKRQHIEAAERFYERHGGKAIVIARFVPVVRTFAPFVAGHGQDAPPTLLAVQRAGGAGLGGDVHHRRLLLWEPAMGREQSDPSGPADCDRVRHARCGQSGISLQCTTPSCKRKRLGKGEVMDCPVCGDKLREIERYGVMIDICPALQGLLAGPRRIGEDRRHGGQWLHRTFC